MNWKQKNPWHSFSSFAEVQDLPESIFIWIKEIVLGPQKTIQEFT